MKEVNYYTDEFKKSVVKEVLSGHIGKVEAQIHPDLKMSSLPKIPTLHLRKSASSFAVSMKLGRRSPDIISLTSATLRMTSAGLRMTSAGLRMTLVGLRMTLVCLRMTLVGRRMTLADLRMTLTCLRMTLTCLRMTLTCLRLTLT